MPKDKYEDEIRDILNRMDDFIPEGEAKPPPRPRPQPSSPRSSWGNDLRRQLQGYSSTSLLAGFVLFALAAGILSKIYGPFGMLAALLSVGCLIAAIALPLFSRHYGRPEQRWRGRIIELDSYRPQQPSSLQRAWRRVKRFFGWR